jgi:hypothetical protein
MEICKPSYLKYQISNVRWGSNDLGYEVVLGICEILEFLFGNGERLKGSSS